jgi:hypothetical protein
MPRKKQQLEINVAAEIEYQWVLILVVVLIFARVVGREIRMKCGRLGRFHRWEWFPLPN